MRPVVIVVWIVFEISLSFGQAKRDSSALSTLVEAEKTFARTSLEIGTRPAFMKFFADDAVVFRPSPVRYKAMMKDVPVAANPLETTLAWEPLYADISASGDLGYTTGPSVWTDHSAAQRPPYYGYFFSVWKKQSSGEWKVAFDIGSEQPGLYTGPRTFHPAPTVEPTEALPSSSPEEHIVSLMSAEQEFLEAAQKDGRNNALVHYSAETARIYREGHVPIVGIDSIRSYFSVKPYLSQWQPMFCDVARSGELGYVYGAYQVADRVASSTSAENGYYLRVWKRDASNKWKFVAEVTNPLPPESPPPR